MRRDILARGKRIDESKPGTGIGLAMVQQIVTLYGGEINLSVSPLGGLRASVILPGHLQF
jgi:signal transduction histidine kinase